MQVQNVIIVVCLFLKVPPPLHHNIFVIGRIMMKLGRHVKCFKFYPEEAAVSPKSRETILPELLRHRPRDFGRKTIDF